MNERDEKLLRELSMRPVPLPPMTTGDKIATTIATVILLLWVGAIWAGIFGIVWAFTGWTP